MKSLNDVTIITLVKDNAQASSLLIKFLKKKKIKINHIIADGSKKKQEKEFQEINNSKQKYFYFGEDQNYLHVWKKIYFSLSKTKTKYFYFLDQGDLLNFNTLSKCATFLNKNKNYSSATGKIYNFSEINNNFVLGEKLYKDIKITSDNSDKEKIFKNFNFRSYHGLHKKIIMKKVLQILIQQKIKDSRTGEFLIDLSYIINGKIFYFDEILYLHNTTNYNKEKIHPMDKVFKGRDEWYKNYFSKMQKKLLTQLIKKFPSKIYKKDIDRIITEYQNYNDLNSTRKKSIITYSLRMLLLFLMKLYFNFFNDFIRLIFPFIKNLFGFNEFIKKL